MLAYMSLWKIYIVIGRKIREESKELTVYKINVIKTGLDITQGIKCQLSLGGEMGRPSMSIVGNGTHPAQREI